jgi:hypothetical protein
LSIKYSNIVRIAVTINTNKIIDTAGFEKLFLEEFGLCEIQVIIKIPARINSIEALGLIATNPSDILFNKVKLKSQPINVITPIKTTAQADIRVIFNEVDFLISDSFDIEAVFKTDIT